MVQEADAAALSSRVRLAVLKDGKLDVTALSEPIERWMDEPLSGLLSDGKLNIVEKDEPPKEEATTDPTATARRSVAERRINIWLGHSLRQSALARPGTRGSVGSVLQAAPSPRTAGPSH